LGLGWGRAQSAKVAAPPAAFTTQTVVVTYPQLSPRLPDIERHGEVRVERWAALFPSH